MIFSPWNIHGRETLRHRSNGADDGCNNHVSLNFRPFQTRKQGSHFAGRNHPDGFQDPFIHVTVDSFRNGVSRLLLLARRIRVLLQVVGIADPLDAADRRISAGVAPSATS